MEQIARDFYASLFAILTDIYEKMPTAPWGNNLGTNAHGWTDRVFDDAMRSKGYTISNGSWLFENTERQKEINDK